VSLLVYTRITHSRQCCNLYLFLVLRAADIYVCSQLALFREYSSNARAAADIRRSTPLVFKDLVNLFRFLTNVYVRYK